MIICGAHSNTCDPLYVEDFFLAVTRSGGYKKYTYEALKEIMLQMDIVPFIYVAIWSYMSTLIRRSR